MPNIGGPELMLILVLVIIFFGLGRVPDAMRDIGRSIGELRKAANDVEDITGGR